MRDPDSQKPGHNPYSELPDHAFWSRAVAAVPPFAVDPLINSPFLINRNDAIASAGSCFAEHLSRNLQALGFHYFVAEQVPAGEREGHAPFPHGTETFTQPGSWCSFSTGRMAVFDLACPIGAARPTNMWIPSGRVLNPVAFFL